MVQAVTRPPVETQQWNPQTGGSDPQWTLWMQQLSQLLGNNSTGLTSLLGRFASPRTISTPTVTASPFVYQNTAGYLVQVVVQGAGVVSTSFSQDGSTYYPFTPGSPVILSAGDYLKVIWGGSTPTMVVSPL